MKFPQMSERLAYSVMVSMLLVGGVMIMPDMINLYHHKHLDISLLGKIGFSLMIMSSLIFLYHLFTVVTEIENRRFR